jgi:hypothetical protein
MPEGVIIWQLLFMCLRNLKDLTALKYMACVGSGTGHITSCVSLGISLVVFFNEHLFWALWLRLLKCIGFEFC